jgi:ABC-2 type transport system ATP-binding protein
MKKVIEVRDLSRSFKHNRGVKKAIDNLTFDVNKGEIFGILGPNGAGKTTTIKILTTLLLPTSGIAKVLGYDVVTESEKIRKKINFVYGGEKGVYGRLTALEYMYYFCTLYKIPKKEQKKKVENLLVLVGLEEAINQRIHTFSKGMIQRLHIARCLINDPEVIFLDEPTIGLDPIGAKMLRDLVKELSLNGITIILTTHYMQEADELCDRIAFVKNGKINLIGDPIHIKESCNNKNIFEAIVETNNISSLQSDTKIKVLNINEIKYSFYEISFEIENLTEDVEGVTKILQKYSEVINIKRKKISLEEAYIYHMKGVE